MALLEQRKKQLAAEGLFDVARKQRLPFLPEVIGIVTSPSGAGIRDMLHRLAERFPRRVLLWPVAVQGEFAAEQVAAAITGFNALPETGPVPRPDVLIVARGGGSLEDLWAFNEEVVVRAAAASRIPLISAVGHETDTTLIDYAADRRAPTPTAAAELAVPVRAELAHRLAQLDHRMFHGMKREIGELQHRLVGLARGLPDPLTLLGHAAQRLDDLAERLPHAVHRRIERCLLHVRGLAARLRSPAQLLQDTARHLASRFDRLAYHFRGFVRDHTRQLERLAGRLTLDELRTRLPRHASTLASLAVRQDRAAAQAIRSAEQRLASASSLLMSLSYEGVLARGFALVRDDHGQLVASAVRARGETALEIQFHDGRVPTMVARGGAPKPARTGPPAPSAQRRLL
jgi:exodeoxyribonuclease VII large subunit